MKYFEQFCWIFIEIILRIFTSWTIGYHISILLSLPSKLNYLIFLFIFSFLQISFFSSWNSKKYRFSDLEKKLFKWKLPVFTIFACSTTGLLSLFISKPDADDYSYFHRALTQLNHLHLPFSLKDTTHNLTASLPPISLMHALTSYEHFIAMLSHLFRIDPLWAYQNLGSCFSASLLPLVYNLFFKQLKLNNSVVIWATTFSLLFLLMDGNLHRSFGNFTIVRCWQGKSILVMLLVPIGIAASYKFLHLPTIRNFSIVFMISVSAVGLSSTGIFLIPILFFGSSVAFIMSYGCSWKVFRRALLLNSSSCYCICLSGLLIFGIISTPNNTLVWEGNWPRNWLTNLSLVLGNFWSIFRDIILLFFLPLITLKNRHGRFLFLYSLTICIIYANPLTGSFWIELIKPAVFWRLTYLFPLSLCCGLLAVLLRNLVYNTNRLSPIILLIMLFFIFSKSYQFSIFNKISFKSIAQYKFPTQENALATDIAHLLIEKHALAPEEVVTVLGLVEPKIKWEANRRAQTIHIFLNAGMPREGKRRFLAQELISTGKTTADRVEAFKSSISMGVNAIIVNKKFESQILSILDSLTEKWQRNETSTNYILFQKKI